ncbi:MAG: hypothetical protein WCD80_06590 [Desulfobaccales bacterium]
MNFNLLMLNLFIGMCRGSYGLPKDLKNLGYVDKWIEYKFNNQDLDIVHPDLIISSEKNKHTILIEFKSGSNTDDDQLKRYFRLTRSDIITKAFLSPLSVNLHDIAIVGKNEHRERLKIGIEKRGYTFPLILETGKGLKLFYNQFQVSETTNIFKPLLKVNWKYIPRSFVPVNSESDLWEIAELLLPKILKYLKEKRTTIDIEEICQDCCITWDIMGKPGKDDFRSNLKKVLAKAARHEFRGIFRSGGRKFINLEIINNPLDTDMDKLPRVFRNLREKQKKFIERLRTGKAFKGQMELPLEY